jgi:tRNA-Thr(GGU) m(6)t(6)A37 methyltransferase TsaA
MDTKPIAYFHSPFGSKFGIPRQSGLVPETEGTIVFTPEFRNPDALKGLEGFDYIWLLWEFSERKWQPTVRPPRLGGNKTMGVFATRSPFRPNPIGLSSVKITGIKKENGKGTVIHTTGADLMNGTPILDIKPYVAYTDSHPSALGGFAGQIPGKELEVDVPENLETIFPPEIIKTLKDTLALDPRPRYQKDPARIYGMSFYGYDVKFTVSGNKLYIREITSSSNLYPNLSNSNDRNGYL